MEGPGAALALIDGEHYPPVVRDALALVGRRHPIAAALLLGGSEKLVEHPTAATYGVPELLLANGDPPTALRRLLADGRFERVIDLSDEPVLGLTDRLLLAAIAHAAGATYEAGGLTLEAPVREAYPLASIAIVGTGKRIGKTSVSAHLARLAAARLADAGRVVVVAMGRGGPAEPELVDPSTDGAPDVRALLERARRSEHAASDFLEDAILAGVPTVGARRCGAGPAGDVVASTVPEAARLAAGLEPALTLFEGSGAAFPPIACTRTLLVCPAGTPPSELTASLGALRPLLADAIVITGADAAPAAADRLGAALTALVPGVPVLACRLLPSPAAPVRGRRVACFTTAPADALQRVRIELERRHGADVCFLSGDLARRDVLRGQLDAGALHGVDAVLVEIKAAAIDVVAEAAEAAGIPVVFLDNRPEAADGSDSLDRLLLTLVDEALHAASASQPAVSAHREAG